MGGIPRLRLAGRIGRRNRGTLPRYKCLRWPPIDQEVRPRGPGLIMTPHRQESGSVSVPWCKPTTTTQMGGRPPALDAVGQLSDTLV
jgi:hypothetical protein